MDLGIKGKNAIVCAASKGLGKGCAMSLAREGVNLTINARTKDALEAAANEIRDATGVRVTTVAGDVTTDAVRSSWSGRSTRSRTARYAPCPSQRTA